MKENQIFISGNVPSLKNSKRIIIRGHKPSLISSKSVMRYKEECGFQYIHYKSVFQELIKSKEKPYRIGFYFVRDTKSRFDYINIAQLPLDLMTKFGWLEDDDANNVIPVFLGYEVDKRNAGVRIEVL